MLKYYRFICLNSTFLFQNILNRRVHNGKEDPARVQEKQGLTSFKKPPGRLVWIHGASIGEARSALIIIDRLLSFDPNLHVLLTTTTLTSAKMFTQNLPQRAFHQYYPLDHPLWVNKFLDYWKPDLAIWMESELWPNMLSAIAERHIGSILVNAKMSQKSYSRWKYLRSLLQPCLGAFSYILTQTDLDKVRYEQLGARSIITTGNLKYSARPLSFDKDDLHTLRHALSGRTIWLYASTHKGEEELACRIHRELKAVIPDIITIIVPRHPERSEQIISACSHYGLRFCVRNTYKEIPSEHDDIYLVNTLGELGLFYRLSPLACIGRSFSEDGGGGHNPIEAAQLGCAILHGPNVQNLQEIFDDMALADAAICIENERQFVETLRSLLTDREKLTHLQLSGKLLAENKERIIDSVMSVILPLLPLPSTSNEILS